MPTSHVLKALVPQIADTAEHWRTSTTPIPKDTLVVATDTRTIKIGDGVHPYSQLLDHSHGDQYASIYHAHYFGYGEKWFRSMPRLVTKRDMARHPELIECNGQYVDDTKATNLIDWYDGVTCISPVATGLSTEQYTISGNTDGDLLKAFGGAITEENLNDTHDQWAYTTNRSGRAVIELTLRGTEQYILTGWECVSLAGASNHPLCGIPTPDTFQWEVYNETTSAWDVIQTYASEANWGPNALATGTFTTPSIAAKRFRLTILSWIQPDPPDIILGYNDATNSAVLPQGLRRIRFMGKQVDKFAVPTLISPHKDFVYAIPMDDLGVGMKHEEIGDIYYAATMTVPSNRLLCDGKKYLVNAEKELYAVIGKSYAPVIPGISHTVGTVTTSDRELDIANGQTDLVYLTEATTVVSKIKMTINTGADFTTPRAFTIHRKNPDLSETLLYTASAITTQETEYKLNNNTLPGHLILRFAERVDPLKPIRVVVDVYGCAENSFHVPTMRPADGAYAYIVKSVRTEDVNAGIVLRLQNNIVELQDLIGTLSTRLVDCETKLAAMTPSA